MAFVCSDVSAVWLRIAVLNAIDNVNRLLRALDEPGCDDEAEREDLRLHLANFEDLLSELPEFERGGVLQ